MISKAWNCVFKNRSWVVATKIDYPGLVAKIDLGLQSQKSIILDCSHKNCRPRPQSNHRLVHFPYFVIVIQHFTSQFGVGLQISAFPGLAIELFENCLWFIWACNTMFVQRFPPRSFDTPIHHGLRTNPYHSRSTYNRSSFSDTPIHHGLRMDTPPAQSILTTADPRISIRSNMYFVFRWSFTTEHLHLKI